MVKIPDFPRYADHDFPTLDDRVEDQGLTARIRRRASMMRVARQLRKEMEEQHISKTEMASRMGTSRAQLDRILDPLSHGLTMESLARAAEALGHSVQIELIKKAA